MPTHGANCNSSLTTVLYKEYENADYSWQGRKKYTNHKNCRESGEDAFEVIHQDTSRGSIVAVVYRSQRQDF